MTAIPTPDVSYFNVFDGIVLFIVGASLLAGLLRGFTREVLGLFGWIGAIFATFYGFAAMRPLARSLIDHTLLADATLGVVLFLFFHLLLSAVGRSVSDWVRHSLLSGLDRSLGLLFGTLRGVVVASLLFMAAKMNWSNKEQPQWLAEAQSKKALKISSEMLIALVPASIVPPALTQRLREASDDVSRLMDAEQLVRSLATPKAQSQEKSSQAEAEGYNDTQRQNLNRVIQNLND
ncbi:MAG: CvpA family protein [Holosporales bacterium]